MEALASIEELGVMGWTLVGFVASNVVVAASSLIQHFAARFGPRAGSDQAGALLGE